MLKTNLKIWTIVLVICLVGQFLWKNVPTWIEQGKEDAQVEIAQMEEERQATVPSDDLVK